MESLDQFYDKNSPLEFLETLKGDIKRKDQLDIWPMASPPGNWVKEEHLPELMMLIYSLDSTKGIVNDRCSYLPEGKFSSIGLKPKT